MLTNSIALLAGVTSVFNILCAVIVVFYERKNPSVTWAWLILVLLAPYVGFIFYLMFGFESKKVREFAHKAQSDEKLLDNLKNSEIPGLNEAMAQYGLITGIRDKAASLKTITGSTHFDDIVYLNILSGRAMYSVNNDVEIFHDGGKFDALIRDINNAQNFIHLEYYIFKGDGLGGRLIDALAKKAAEGVEVRLLIDGMGCARTPKKIFEPLTKCGGELGVYVRRQIVRLNFRNHRKIAIIDGCIGYNGGLNIGDEYLGESKRYNHWRDCHLRIEGEAVRQLQLRFIMDWNFAAENKIIPDAKYFPVISEAYGNTGIQVVSSGPDTKWYSIAYALAKMINEADYSIYIQTPYFVPDDNILESLRIAALSGKDVRIMIPGKPDHPFVYGAAISYLGELLPAGVKCFRYERGFVHSKLMIIDGIISSVGTANMDVRSFKLNFETNTFIYNEEVSSKLEAQFIRDLNDCTQIDQNFYSGRSRFEKIKESTSRLLSPLL